MEFFYVEYWDFDFVEIKYIFFMFVVDEVVVFKDDEILFCKCVFIVNSVFGVEFCWFDWFCYWFY